ncbi:MAG: four helix bundle protein [Candidatus Sumerlaeia bacterium]|nr:four helix bundle protein [Candidatus Sumerlaeia bacterium]
MAEQEIQKRTFEFARRVLRLARVLDEDRIGRLIVGQVVRSATSIGANVEEAQGSQSKPDFIAKMGIARKEARETLYWLRLVQAEALVPPDRLADLVKEADELVRIISAIVVSARNNPE